MGKSNGFTLLELMIVIFTMGFLATAITPNLSRWIDQYSTSSKTRMFMQTVRYARYNALNSSRSITLCPLKSNKCSNNWNKPISVFHDANNNKVLDNQEQVLRTVSISQDNNTIITRTGTGDHIRFNWNGHAFGSATTFVICARTHHQASRQVVISFQGRIRSQNYLSRKGTPYTSLGGLTCS